MRHRPRSTTTMALAGTAAALMVGALGVAPAAQGAERDGRCQPGEFCYFHNSGQKGAVSDFRGSVGDYGTSQPSCYEFRGRGRGKGECIKNDAASVWNRTGRRVTVFFNSGFSGPSQVIGKGRKANLRTGIKNENASHRIGGTGGGGGQDPAPPSGETKPMSRVLYGRGGGSISAGFDGYQSTPGRHEGIDFTLSVGARVNALTSGVVTRVAEGARGGSGLSSIAVYNAKQGATVIYLHSDPSVRTGQRIRIGQRIATEDWRGVSSSSAGHTHVEMRPGRQEYASKSVGDPTLDNPDPRPFWKARGYSIG